MEDANSFAIERFFFVAKQIAPFLRPEVGKLGPLQECIDESLALVGRLVH